jgi:hypothetical protein
MTKCLDCGKEIDKRSTRCVKCRVAYLVGSNSPNYKHGKTKNNKCIECGTPITYEAIKCRACAGKDRSKMLDIKGTKNPNYRHGKCIENLCVDCGEIIDHRATRCAICYFKQNVGPKNSSYIHGRGNAPYPASFTFKLRETVRIRDNHTCQLCGKLQKNLFGNRRLSIHHIDYNKENNIIGNLISLCLKCHVRTNTHRVIWIELFKNKIHQLIQLAMPRWEKEVQLLNICHR